MRDIPVSNCESDFVLKCIKEGRRFDGSDLLRYRPVTLSFGLDYGCCVVSMGDTKVLAQIKAEMDRPRENRSNEGNLGIFVEMSTMGSASLDPTKPGNLGIEIQRMLEKTILMSRAVDLEELCVRVGEYAWNLSLRLQILSHDGNLLDCASIASLAALTHFKRPDVTVSGKDVTVHTFEEKYPVPLTINHQPFCVSFGFFDNGNSVIADPNSLEEKCADGKLMISMNKHKEVCCTQMSGRILIHKDQVLKCTNLVGIRVKELSELVKKAVEADSEAKKSGKKHSSTKSSKNLKEKLETSRTTTNKKVNISEQEDMTSEKEVVEDGQDDRENRLCWLINHGQNTASTGVEKKDKEPMKRKVLGNEEDSEDSEEEIQVEMQLTT